MNMCAKHWLFDIENDWTQQRKLIKTYDKRTELAAPRKGGTQQ
jgi:hypothetical protein